MSDSKPPTPSPSTQHIVRTARARIRQATGRQYPALEAQLDQLTGEAVLELVRLIGDMEQNVTRAKRQAIFEPWRRG